jgi:hypothetical protein
LAILNNVSAYFLNQGTHPKLNERSIVKQDENGILMAYYIRWAIKLDEGFMHLLPLLLEKL